MQTFLPYASFLDSALCLDNKRLGKQRVETLQILNALVHKKGWIHHPATIMWKGYESALISYGERICEVWIAKGFKDTCFDKIRVFRDHVADNLSMPPWLGDNRIHSSHRSNLLRKFPEHYGQFNWQEPNDIPYFWPTEKYKIL